MMKDHSQLQLSMNEALDGELSPEEQVEFQSQLEDAPEAAVEWDHLRDTDRLLRDTPKIAPAAGFANRVMAAIAAMPLPEFISRKINASFMVGLAVAGLLVVPLLSLTLLLILSVLTDPGTLHLLLKVLIDGIGSTIGVLADIRSGLQTIVSDTPGLLLLLLSTVIPITMLWSGVIWHLLGRPSVLANRPKS
jgi:hypothetical protein